MDPLDLENDELEYELLIRNLPMDGTERIRCQRLYSALQNEGLLFPTTTKSTSADHTTELPLCQVKYTQIFNEYFQEAKSNPYLRGICKSRLIHLHSRVNRLFIPGSSAMDDADVLMDRIEAVLHGLDPSLQLNNMNVPSASGGNQSTETQAGDSERENRPRVNFSDRPADIVEEVIEAGNSTLLDPGRQTDQSLITSFTSRWEGELANEFEPPNFSAGQSTARRIDPLHRAPTVLGNQGPVRQIELPANRESNNQTWSVHSASALTPGVNRNHTLTQKLNDLLAEISEHVYTPQRPTTNEVSTINEPSRKRYNYTSGNTYNFRRNFPSNDVPVISGPTRTPQNYAMSYANDPMQNWTNNIGQGIQADVGVVENTRPNIQNHNDEDSLNILPLAYTQHNNQRGSRKWYNPVAHWKVRFSGDGKCLSLKHFLQEIKILSIADNVSEEDLLKSVVYLFEGPAKNWYCATYTTFTTWSLLEASLSRHFLPHQWDAKLRREIESRKQQKKESIRDYFVTMQTYFGRLNKSISEIEQVNITMSNMLPKYLKPLWDRDPKSMSELFELCMRLDEMEDMIARQDYNSGSTPLEPMLFGNRDRNIHQLDQTKTSDEENVGDMYQELCALRRHFKSSLQFNPQSKPMQQPIPSGTSPNSPEQLPHVQSNNSTQAARPLICWNCDQPNHTFFWCPAAERRIFCFKCGEKNSITPSCQRCAYLASGNAMRGPQSAAGNQGPQP